MRNPTQPGLPAPQGLYDPRFEHDACGVSFVASLKGEVSRSIVMMGLGALCNMEHRGATGAEADTGDGAGILIQVPDRFLRGVVGFELPAAGAYAVGMAFLPADPTDAEKAQEAIATIVADEGLTVLGWRDVPVNPACLGASARKVMPIFRQLVISDPAGTTGIELDRKVFITRKRVEHELPTEQQTYFPSLSSRTLIYKGMLTTPQLAVFFPDLGDERLESGLVMVHSRFSTNTFPSWPLAHPYRFIAHNGEINTVQGNRNWMRTRESLLASDLLPGLERAYPICTPGGSDSASFDEVLELLHLGGRSLPHAMLMMIPEAWENHDTMDATKRAFYRFHSSLMEPWDGPASVAFTDGTLIGAVLDRNGLRPSRYWVTDDDLVVAASEVGVLDIDPAKIVRKGRLQPGRMFLIDTAAGADRRGRRDQARPGGGRAVCPMARRGRGRARRVAGARAHRVQPSERAAPPAGVRLHPRGAEDHRRPDGQGGRRADRLDGHRHPDRRAQRATAAAVRLLPAAVRPGHQPAARRHPRRGRHLGRRIGRARVEPASARPGELPPADLAVPDHRQRRARQDHPHRRRQDVPRARRRRDQRSLPSRRRRAGVEASTRRDPHGDQQGDRRRGAHRRAERSQQRRRVRPDPVVVAHRSGASPLDPREAAHQGRLDRRVRRCP